MFDVRTDQWFFFRHLSIYIFLAVPPKKSPKNTTPQGGDGQILAVYDLGGGTFDISILEISGGVAWPWWTRWWTTWKGRGTPKKPVKKAVNSQPFLIFWEFYGFISFFWVVLGLGCPNILNWLLYFSRNDIIYRNYITSLTTLMGVRPFCICISNSEWTPEVPRFNLYVKFSWWCSFDQFRLIQPQKLGRVPDALVLDLIPFHFFIHQIQICKDTQTINVDLKLPVKQEHL